MAWRSGGICEAANSYSPRTCDISNSETQPALEPGFEQVDGLLAAGDRCLGNAQLLVEIEQRDIAG